MLGRSSETLSVPSVFVLCSTFIEILKISLNFADFWCSSCLWNHYATMIPIKILIFTTLIPSLPMTAIAAECTRDGLLAAANTYLAAQIAGKPTSLKLDSANFAYSQNNKVTDLSTGLLSTPLTIDLSRTTADTTACASYTMWISASSSHPYVVSTQIRHTNNDTSTIASIDTIASTTNDLFFDAAKTLSYIRAENWSPLPPSTQPSRALLKSIGDIYLDMWTNSTAVDAIPWGTECERVEGSRYATCKTDLPRGGSTKENGMRRYVIDEAVGSVQISCQFDGMG